MKRPVIVLTPQAKAMEAPFQRLYHYTNSFNTDAVRRAGGLPVLSGFLEPEEAGELMERAQGLLLSGGEDIDPALYGQEKLAACGAVSPERDRSDLCLLEAALAQQKPVLCICRGCQAANVYFGGSLWQDIPSQLGPGLQHSCYPEHARETAHPVEVLPDTPLARLVGAGELWVNSLHHQAVRDLAPGLEPMAVSPDGLVEAWYRPGTPWLWGIQWHPEMLEDSPNGTAILRQFLQACGAG